MEGVGDRAGWVTQMHFATIRLLDSNDCASLVFHSLDLRLHFSPSQMPSPSHVRQNSSVVQVIAVQTRPTARPSFISGKQSYAKE